MSIFKKKTIISKILLLCFVLFFIFLFPSLQKINAGDVEVIKIISPTNNSVSQLGPFNFSLTYKVSAPSTQPPIDAIVFTATVDGEPHKVAGNDLKLVDSLYIVNKTKDNSRIGKTDMASWGDFNPAGPNAGIYSWKLYDYYTNTVYGTGSFVLKEDLAVGKGWYFIGKYKSTEKYYFIVSDRYEDKTKCEQGWEVEKTKVPDTTLFEACKEYVVKPYAPADIPLGGNTPPGGTSTDTNYVLLAPIPDGSGGLMENFESDPAKNPCAFGKYMNILIKILIGIGAVLAMIMIVKGGLEYMASSLPSGKEAGRGTITNAILGLLIALGSYLLLYTVNPNLLNLCLDQQLPQVEITIDPETETAPWTETAQITGPTKTCTEGYTNVSTQGQPSTINVCKSISNNLTKLLAAAKLKNFILSGSGSRTLAQQTALRNQHGCPNPTSPPSACHPPTARPGRSKHESGKAVDFNCNGAPIAGTSCLAWLRQNAGNFGFKNLASEPWHWSDTGS